MKAKTLQVTQDDDGGVTVRDHRSGVVVSLISSGPDERPNIALEPYPYESGKVVTIDTIQPSRGRHPFYILTVAPAPDEAPA